MLIHEYRKAEKLAAENDTPRLHDLYKAYDRKVTRVAYVGLVSLLMLLLGPYVLSKVSPGFAVTHDTAYLVLTYAAASGIAAYFILSKRFTEGRQRVSLALELKQRSASTADPPKKE